MSRSVGTQPQEAVGRKPFKGATLRRSSLAALRVLRRSFLAGLRVLRPSFLAALLVAMQAVGPETAAADPADTIGLGFSGRSRSGALTASAADFSAAYYNPAGLAMSQAGNLSASLVQVLTDMTPGSADAGGGSFFEVGGALPLLERPGFPEIWFGTAVLMPAARFYEMKLADDTQPIFPLYAGRERRLSLTASVGVRILDALSLGAGLQMLPTVSADVALDLADPEGVNALDVNVGYNLSPLVGVVVQPVDALTLGAVWHGENHSPLDLPVDVDAGGIDLNAWVTAVTYFVPHRVSLGAEWRFLDRLAAEVDATWYHYSGFEAGAPEVSLYDSTGKDPLNVRNADPGFSDTLSPAVALRYSGPLEATLSYRWAPSPVPEQTAESNLLCGDTHTVASGFRVLLTESQQTPRRLFLDAALFYSYMPRQRDFKDSPMPGNPGYPSLEFGGHRVGIGVGMEVEY